MIGRRIGSWVLERELGRGGMGAVFEARHVSLHSRAAVKVLAPGLESEESFRQRFHREADLQARLRHTNVARVLDYLEDGGQWFLIVEYLERGSLAELLSRGESVSREQALLWTQQALAGLGHAHQNGIVHRDMKPANLMLGSNGEIVVVDFGIARNEDSLSLTATGVSVGTPHYMSPEQIVTPERVDWRTDIYSLGIVLYELLAGRKPFDADSQFALLQAHVSSPPPPLRTIKPDIPTALEAAVFRAIAKKPEDRFPDCAAMSRELERVGKAPQDSFFAAPPPVPAAGGTVHSISHYEPAHQPAAGGPSADNVRNRKRRTFQTSLAAGAIASVFVAGLLAYKLASTDPEPDTNVPPSTAVDTAITTTTETTATHNQFSIAGEPPIPIEKPRIHQERPPTDTSALNATGFPPPNSDSVVTTQPPTTTMSSVPTQPPPSPPPTIVLPERPRIAVIGTGSDTLLAGAIEQTIEQRLARYDVSDESGDPDVQELLAKKGADVSFKQLGAQLLKSGYHILVMVRVDEAESRSFKFRDIDGHAKAARARLNAYLLPTGSTLGSGWTEGIEYTEYSAAAKANQAFVGPTADLRIAIDAGWAQLRAARPH
jgi:eukaryotic-like serine/threonine-protein kinase